MIIVPCGDMWVYYKKINRVIAFGFLGEDTVPSAIFYHDAETGTVRRLNSISGFEGEIV